MKSVADGMRVTQAIHITTFARKDLATVGRVQSMGHVLKPHK